MRRECAAVWSRQPVAGALLLLRSVAAEAGEGSALEPADGVLPLPRTTFFTRTHTATHTAHRTHIIILSLRKNAESVQTSQGLEGG